MQTVRIASIDFPSEILQAQQDGRLVIFAGAGTSIAPPSSLPNFDALAMRLSAGIVSQEPNEPLDRFLGRVETAGGNIQRKTTSILSDPQSLPNTLHESLVGMFPDPSTLRIVTTNFDLHFETVMGKRWPTKAIDVYHAPALPHGDDFTGLVYLHGRLQRPERLVLTDQDFGRAYLTQGWARRFLQDLFARYVVLFIGYRHEDVVINYLARGLPPATEVNRYALVDSTHSRQRWEFLGIKPVIYEWDKEHSRLQYLLRAWEQLSQQGALEREVQIRQMVERSPQALNAEEEDYLLYSLRNQTWAQYFFRYAEAPDWLEWTNSKGILDPLFDLAANGETIALMADWFCSNPLGDRGSAAVRVAALRRKPLHNVLWRTLGYRVWVSMDEHKGRSKEQSQLVASWFAVLAYQEPTQAGWELVTNWLQRLLVPQEKELLLLLLHILTSPRLIAQDSFFPEESVRHKIVIRGQAHWLKEFKERLLTDTQHVGEEVLSLAIRNLQEAHYILRLLGKASDTFDELSYSRSRVEESARLSLQTEPILILVDYAWIAIKWLAEGRPEILAHSLFSAAESPSHLIRRICISGIRILPQLSCEAKVRLVIEKHWLGYPKMPETFRLLAECYPGLQEESRREFLDAAERLYHEEDARNKERDPDVSEFASYNIFNLFIWLAQAAPECALLEERLARIKSVHPEYAPREHPDLDHWTSGVRSVQTVTPHPVGDILSWTPDSYLERLADIADEPTSEFPFDSRLRGLLETTTEAVNQAPEKGIEIARELAGRNNWESPVWRYIFRGWEKSDLTEQTWDEILTLVQENPCLLIGGGAEEVAALIEQQAKNRQPPLTEGMTWKGISVALLILEHSRDEGDESHNGDWLQGAINHSSGKVAEFAVHSLQIIWDLDNRPDGWEIPEPLRNLLNVLVTESAYGRAVLGSQIHFLLAVDENWTKSNILPLFDWQTDPAKADQVWSGFLDWGRPIPLVRGNLLPYFQGLFNNREKLSKAHRDRLAEHLSWFAYGDEGDPLTWLREFLRGSGDEDRANFAMRIASLLGELNSEQRVSLWTHWLGSYFRARIEGPPPIGRQEKVSLIRWCEEYPERLSELVNLLEELDPPELEMHQLYRILREDAEDAEEAKPLGEPDGLGRLLLWILKGQRKEQFLEYYCARVRKLLDTLHGKIENNLYRRLVERYSELGCSGASDLLEK